MRLNKNYREETLWFLTDDIASNLALQMWTSWFIGDKIAISPESISFEAFEEDEMNTVRKTLLLLVVAVSNYQDDALIEKWVVTLPDDSYVDGLSYEKGGDIFEHFPFTAKLYCLYRAYHLLTKKLHQRNTPLFRILYICICLELWRTKVPPEVIVWPIWWDVHWWSVIVSLTWNFSEQSRRNLIDGWFWSFVDFLKKEVERISDAEIPGNILEHFYNNNGIGVKREKSLVQGYLAQIMAQSRKKI